MAESANQLSPTSPEDNEQAAVFSISQDKDGSWRFSRRKFLYFSMIVGGAPLLKGACPRFGAGPASTTIQPVQAAMMPLPSVYVHTKPSIDSNIVDTLQHDDLVLLIDDHPDLGWVEVATRSDQRGWLDRRFVDFSRALTRSSQDSALSSNQTPTPTLTSRPTVLPSQSGGAAIQAGTHAYLPIIVNLSAPTSTPTPTNTPTNIPTPTPCPSHGNLPTPTPCPLYVTPCYGNTHCPPVDSCIVYVRPCPTNSMCPPVGSCLLYTPCTCNAFPCTCNANIPRPPCTCNAFPCTCNANIPRPPCTCNFSPCFVT